MIKLIFNLFVRLIKECWSKNFSCYFETLLDLFILLGKEKNVETLATSTIESLYYH